jgi:hypothetical protein
VQTFSSTTPPLQTFSSPFTLEAFPAPVMPLQNLFSFSVLHSAPADIGWNLATMDVSNLQTSAAVAIVVHLALVDVIVPLSNTHQVISLKLTKHKLLVLANIDEAISLWTRCFPIC